MSLSIEKLEFNHPVMRESSFSINNIKITPSIQAQPFINLNDGNLMPMLGLGTWNAQGKRLKEAIKAALYSGYLHIDTATNYKNENLVGEAVAECIEEGLVKREDLFITTKLWNNSHTRASVSQALEKSLKALNMRYVDLYLIHYPIAYKEGDVLSPINPVNGQLMTSDVDYLETWLGMEDTKQMGLASSIGVSNFNSKQISRILQNCSIPPAINQVECHPYLNQSKLLQFCRSHGIVLTAYSPLGSPGRLDLKSHLLEDSLIKLMAKKYQCHPAHILIRYQIQRNVVVIPKAIQLPHIESNLDSLTFQLSKTDMIRLDSLNRDYRFMTFERCIKHKHYPFNDEF